MKTQKKFSRHYVIGLLIIFLVIVSFSKNNYYVPISGPLPVNVFNEKTKKTEIQFVRVYKTTKRMNYCQMFRHLPGNRIPSFFGIIPSWKEAPVEFGDQYPKYKRFALFCMVNGTLFRESGVIDYFFQNGGLQSNLFFLSDTNDDYTEEEGSLIIMRCRKP